VIGIFVMPYLAKGRQPPPPTFIAHLEHAIAVAGEDHVSIGTDGRVSATEVTPDFVAAFRKNTQERKALGIAAPYETEDGYLFASDLNAPRRLETLADQLLARGHGEERVQRCSAATSSVCSGRLGHRRKGFRISHPPSAGEQALKFEQHLAQLYERIFVVADPVVPPADLETRNAN